MTQIKYILIQETDSKRAARTIRSSNLPDIKQHLIVAGSLHNDSARSLLIAKLVALRHHHPDAKILGLSELAEKRIKPTDAMNHLRRELSDWL